MKDLRSTSTMFSRKNKYIEYVLNNQLDKSSFVPLSEEHYERKENDVKLVSFYLPQYHAIEENDKWFGKGFTEWTNVTKTVPQYVGHWQPHLPIDVGYYSLDDLNVMKRQVELAKQHGIYGFGFYYYWYNGKKLLEKPIQNFLADKSIDMPFFLFWDSGNWSRLWGGGALSEVLFKQEMEDETAKRFMDDLLPYIKDERYIKINNKPVLVISSPGNLGAEKCVKFIKDIREIAQNNGFEDLHLMSLRGNVNHYDIESYGLDSMLEFFPCGIEDLIKEKHEKIENDKFVGKCWDVEKFIKNKKYLYKAKCPVFKGCFPNWDNTARKGYSGANIYQNTPENYKKWLCDIIKWTKENKKKNEQFVFINAWNEWAEGAHLEPDQKYGYAYLEATKEVMEKTQRSEK